MQSVGIPASLLNHPHVLDVGATIRPGQTIGPLHSTSDRAGFLVATGEILEEAVACADDGCRQILIHYADGRTGHALQLAAFQELAHS